MFIERTDAGTSPLSLTEALAYLKLSAGWDDDVVQSLIDAATQYCEDFTHRSIRESTFTMLQTGFDESGTDCIVIPYPDIASVSKVEYLVSGVWTQVSGTLYYVKRRMSYSEVKLGEGSDWPTDIDDIDDSVRVTFLTKESIESQDLAIAGILRHVASMYADRGDMNAPGMEFSQERLGSRVQMADSARQSGAEGLYKTFSLSGI